MEDVSIKSFLTPLKCTSYMEKHRIYELLFELTTMLIIMKPKDHLLYMKQCIRHAGRRRDTLRIILLASPEFDTATLMDNLHERLGPLPITREDLIHADPMFSDFATPDEVAKNVRSIIRKAVVENDCGWIISGLPRTKQEARALQQNGILPTHVIEIKTEHEYDFRNCVDSLKMIDPQICPYVVPTNKLSKTQRIYRQEIYGLRDVFSHVLVEVKAQDRSIEDVTTDCTKLLQMRRNYGQPCVFRIALIGCRGSGRATVADHLAKELNIVHVNFEYILEQVRQQDSNLADEVRMVDFQWGTRPKPELRIRVIEQWLLNSECTKKGWILTHFPICVEDFKLLDMLPTPPNRVFFIDVEKKICFERLTNRRYNAITGHRFHVGTKECCNADPNYIKIHPNDHEKIVEFDIEEYEQNIGGMKKYAGKTAQIVNGNAPERIVKEQLQSLLLQGPPAAPPRVPKPPEIIKPEDIEYDPDDEPDPRIFDKIRLREPNLPLL